MGLGGRVSRGARRGRSPAGGRRLRVRAGDRSLGGRAVPPLPGGDPRTSTFAIRVADQHPAQTAKTLAGRGIFVWDGNYYALEIMERLRLQDSGGAVRIGFCHYNTRDEVDRVLEELATLA